MDRIEVNLETQEVRVIPLTEAEIAERKAGETERNRTVRITELKRLLAETDYVALSDYDKDKPEVIAQRAAWRAEIRELEA